MRKTFKANLRFHFQDILAALHKLGEENENYQLLSSERNTIAFETGGFTAKEWVESKTWTVEPQRTMVVKVTPSRINQTLLTIEVTRIGLFDPFKMLEKDFKKLIREMSVYL